MCEVRIVYSIEIITNCHFIIRGKSQQKFEITCYITSNDRSFSCPIICTDAYSQCYFVHRHLNNAYHKQAHSLIWMQYLAIIASNDRVYYFSMTRSLEAKLQIHFSSAQMFHKTTFWTISNYIQLFCKQPTTQN